MVGGICAADGLISNTLASQETEYGWWYIENGGLYFNATGLAQNEYGWWYVRDSKVDFGFTGLANNEVGWWYVRNGQIDFSYNGLMCYFDTWWKITGGKVDFDYTGIAPNEYGWWRVKNGQIDFSFNSIASNEHGWFYLNGGKVDFGFTGVAENENGWWYIQNGFLDFSITGNYVDGIRTYNVSNGRVIGCNFYLPQTSIILPDGGYNLSTANIGLKVIKVNQAVCGNSSERYTSSTASAVKTFQRTHGLGVTGIVDITTWKAMGYSEYDWYNLGTYRTPIKVFNGATREYPHQCDAPDCCRICICRHKIQSWLFRNTGNLCRLLRSDLPVSIRGRYQPGFQHCRSRPCHLRIYIRKPCCR